MKKCNLTRDELIESVKNQVDNEYECYRRLTIEQQPLKSIWKNAGVIYEYTILHHYITEMIDTFTKEQLEYLNDSETLESLVDMSLRTLPQRNAESCKSVLNKFFKSMEDIQDGGMQ